MEKGDPALPTRYVAMSGYFAGGAILITVVIGDREIVVGHRKGKIAALDRAEKLAWRFDCDLIIYLEEVH